MTLADARRVLGAEPVGHVGSGAAPSLPHLTYDGEELDKAYPPLQSPPEEHLGDLEDGRADSTLQAGMQVAREIAESARAHGRRRRPPEPALTTPRNDGESGRDSKQRGRHRGQQEQEHRGQRAGTHLEVANVVGHAPRRSGKCGSARTLSSPLSDSDWPALGRLGTLRKSLLRHSVQT